MCPNGHAFFNNPHASCSVILINQNNELLFSKRANEPHKDQYDFPGGFLEFNEDAYQAAVREADEELGIAIKTEDLELIDSELNDYLENDQACDFVFICRKWDGQLHPADDVASYEWKPLDFLRSPDFAWPYPHLYGKLEKLLSGTSHE